jgi:hypothetical protein
MSHDLETTYERLFAYCREREFSGFDPFDGLNSSIFKATPFRHSRAARLLWLQSLKRSAYNFRALVGVKPGVNPKGIALFALAEMSRFRATSDERHAANSKGLLDRLLNMKISGRSENDEQWTAFGYNFDWQSRAFYASQGIPAIVPTAFASQAFIEAYRLFSDERFLEAAVGASGFVLNELNRSADNEGEVCFSYTPVDNTRIYNASLLGAECLARVLSRTDDDLRRSLIGHAVRYVIRRQRADGAWVYGESENQAWADNFHTAYILLSLKRIGDDISDLRSEIEESFELGVNYWLTNFFLVDGTPKYYDKETYPIDIHSAAVAVSTLAELKDVDERALPLARRVVDWTITNMLDRDGFFYYQVRRRRTVKTPFMRWGQAWMAYALARLIEAEG